MSILLGIDRFANTEGMRLRGDKIGILCHAASVDQHFQHLTEICRMLELNVQRCFGPEHGIWADAQDMEAVDEDPRTEPNTGAIKVVDSTGASKNDYTLSLISSPSVSESLRFSFDILINNLKLIPDTYTVYLSSKLISKWEGGKANYFIALESTSTFNNN